MRILYDDISTPVEELAELVFRHFGKTPMGWTGIDKLTEYAHNEQFVENVFGLYDYLRNRDELFLGINPSQYYKIIYKFQLASKELEIDINRINACYFFLANYAVRVYNENFKIIKNSIYEVPFYEFDSDVLKKKVTFLSALLRGYSETIYCDEHTISGETYSPVLCVSGFTIVKKYSMLDAKELYQQLSDCPYKSIDIYIRYYDTPTIVNTDIVGNILVNYNLLPYMKAFYIKVVKHNDVIVDTLNLSIIDEIIEYFQIIIPKIANAYKQLPLQERLWKKIECEYYALKPLRDICNLSWKPIPYKVDIDAITSIDRGIVRVNREIMNLKNDISIMRKLLELNDPREHY